MGKAATAIDGRGIRDEEAADTENVDGRMRRLRNVRDMAVGCGGLVGVAMGKSSRSRMMDD